MPLCKPFLALVYSLVIPALVWARGIPELVENRGQWPEHIVAGADVEGGKWFLGKDGFTCHQWDVSGVSAVHNAGIESTSPPVVRGHVYRVKFEGANSDPGLSRWERKPTYYNYFLGNDPVNWAGSCQAFGRIRLSELYRGIDLDVYTNESFLKYDFIVRPGADPLSIQMNYAGQDSLILSNGRVKVLTSVGEVWEQQPIAWQFIDGKKRYVKCGYVILDNTVRFTFPEGYDKGHELIIDPELIFSTYSGSTSDNFGYTATYDSNGYLYSGSSAFGQGYPTTTGAYQQIWGGGDGSVGLAGTDIALSKYDVSGTFMVWSTFLGGANDELPHSIVCNNKDELIVYGTSSSPNFPVTADAYDRTFNGGISFSPQGVGTNYVNGSDIIIARFNAAGNALIGSTFVGGSGNDGVNTATQLKYNYADEFRGEVDVDSEGNIVIVSSTFSPDFPILSGFQQTISAGQEACVVKLTPDLTDIVWSTFIGGSGDDSGYSVSFDSEENLVVCGGTKSPDFPVTPGVVFPGYSGIADGWIAQIASDGQALLASTFFGSSSYDQLYFVEVDQENEVHVYGQTRAPGNTWVMNAGFSQPNSGMVVAKLPLSLESITWSTVFGTGIGKPNLSPTAFLVDVCDNVYLSGWGGSTNTSSNSGTGDVFGMLTTPGAYQTTTNGSDFYLLVLEDDADAVVYASFFGGNQSAEHVDGGTSRFDRKGVIYQSVCAGCGNHDDFPIKPPNAVSPFNMSNNCNNGVFKFDFELPITVAGFTVPPQACVNQPVTFTSTSANSATLKWDFGDGNTSAGQNPTHEYAMSGEYVVTLVVENPSTCNATDTLRKTIIVREPVSLALGDTGVCPGEQLELGEETPDLSAEYLWSPAVFLSDVQSPNPIFTAGTTTVYTALVITAGCVDTIRQTVTVPDIELEVPGDTLLCGGSSLVLTAEFTPLDASVTWSASADFSQPLNDGPSDADIVVSPKAPEVYYVKVEMDGCVLEDEVSVGLIGAFVDLGGDLAVCYGDTVELAVMNPSPDLSYEWDTDGTILSGQGTPVITAIIASDTWFEVTATLDDECSASDDVIVVVSELNPSMVGVSADPQTILTGQSSQLLALPEGFDYIWTPGETLNDSTLYNPLATPPVTTEYTVMIFNSECSYTSRVKVVVVDYVCGPPFIYVPNAFTPNADNRNERMFVRAKDVTEIYFVIYDRWGEKVFETNSLEKGWDGTFRDRPVDPDVYVYYLRAVCLGGEEYFEEGNITVIR